jgi:hypothetical protein
VTRLVLLPSPLLGGVVWDPVAGRLADLGWAAHVAHLPRGVRSPAEVVAGFAKQLPPRDDVVLVPHSNAGVYVAALAAALAPDRTLQGIVFVDAGLPSSDPDTPTAPPYFREQISRLARDGDLLPPWTSWWPDGDMDVLFPDTETRLLVERSQPRLPMSYFEADVPSPREWAGVPAAYLGFGETYAVEQAEARGRGWPVETLAGEHLHQLVDPDGVTASLDRLLRAIGSKPTD